MIVFLDEVVCISLCANTVGKGMNASVLFSAMDGLVSSG